MTYMLQVLHRPSVFTNGFQGKAITTKSSILDTAAVPDLPLVTIFDKEVFNLTQATVISFNLIATYQRIYMVIMK